MLGNLFILFTCIISIHGYAEFTILQSPKSLLFKGEQPLNGDDLFDVIYASLGNSVSGHSTWTGLNIIDPFNLPRNVIIVTLNGIKHLKLANSAEVKTYELIDHSVQETLKELNSHLSTDQYNVCDINLQNFQNTVGVKADLNTTNIAKAFNVQHLNGELHTADKLFLQNVAYINTLAENFSKLQNDCNIAFVDIFVDAIAKAHGENSKAMAEAITLLAEALKNVNVASQKVNQKNSLILAITNKEDSNRYKRDAQSSSEEDINVAESYNEDYPVIFNIILWFMVTLGFSLLAICYAIATMDPGRDSIIYRMTSTRMKKDN